MRRESCLASDDIRWVPINFYPMHSRAVLNVPPSKGVMKLIDRLERGEFPTIFIEPRNETILKESQAAFEAYHRCHVSMIPVAVKETINDRNPMQPGVEDEEIPV